MKFSKKVILPGSKDCAVCLKLCSNLLNKKYCQECYLKQHKECVKCSMVFFTPHAFELDAKKCNKCVKNEIKNKIKRFKKNNKTGKNGSKSYQRNKVLEGVAHCV